MKFICNGCAKWHDDPCILDVGNEQTVSGKRMRCPFKSADGDLRYCKWEKYEDGKVAKLPKLTAEVFDRPDCPEWAKYAAVDKDGEGWFYEGKPVIGLVDTFVNVSFRARRIDGKFDATDWKNSLVELPTKDAFDKLMKNCAKQQVNKILQKARERRLSEQYGNAPEETKLPDWCKVGKWVWDKRNGYGEIKSVRDDRSACYIEFKCGGGDFVPEAFAKLKQAMLRPYNAEEMRGLVGKVVCSIEDKTFLVLSHSSNAVFFGDFLHTAEDLTLDIYKFPDDSPCGVLEHLEEGGWVK